MSKIGKQQILIPSGVTVTVDGALLRIKGPLGENTIPQHRAVKAEITGDSLQFSPVKSVESLTSQDRSLWGTAAAHARNAIEGVTKGFEKKLEINGVGYRASMEGTTLVLAIGFSHPVKYAVPKGIEVRVDKNIITVRGFNKNLVGQTAAEIRAYKEPEPYKGKGIKYDTEVIRRKAGKKAAA